MLSYCRHVSAGLSHLASKGFVHRDLAARNILVSRDDGYTSAGTVSAIVTPTATTVSVNSYSDCSIITTTTTYTSTVVNNNSPADMLPITSSSTATSYMCYYYNNEYASLTSSSVPVITSKTTNVSQSGINSDSGSANNS